MIDHANHRGLTELFIVGLWMVGLVLVIPKMIASGNYFFGGVLIVGFPLAVFLIDYPAWLLCGALVFSVSGIRIPGLTLNIYMFQAFFCLALLSVFSARLIRGRELPPMKQFHIKAVILFGLVVCLTIAVRGVGLRILGSSDWGGAFYIHMLVGIMAILFLRNIQIPDRHLVRSLTIVCLLSFVGMYFRYTGSDQAMAFAEGEVQRTAGGHVVSGYLIILGFFLLQKYQTFKGWVAFIFLLVSAMILALRSGHRIGIVYNGLLLFFMVFMLPKSISRKYVGLLIIGGITTLIGVILFLDKMPLSYQRALSVIPFLNVSEIALSDAAGTTEWRIELWRLLLEDVPKYLLIGRGLTFDLAEAAHIWYVSMGDNGVAFYAAVHNYHNGPLSLLIDLGLLGLLSGVGFMIAALVNYSKYLKQEWENQELKFFFNAFLAFFFSLTITYIFVYGDLAAAFLKYMTVFFLLETLVFNGVEKYANIPVGGIHDANQET